MRRFQIGVSPLLFHEQAIYAPKPLLTKSTAHSWAMDIQLQTIQSKRGEIQFRRTLSKQELYGENLLPEAFSSDEIIPVIGDTIIETRRIFEKLIALGVPISPFLELGAERGQRSFLLCNQFEAQGFALDLSLDALLFGERLIAEFGFVKTPVRVCGDAYNLPFRSNLFPFVFCIATLHHFPDPTPVVKEVHRVLRDGGYFYFDREPTRGRLTMRLWTRHGYKLSRFEKLLDRLGILGFVSEGGGVEREYGISENVFPLETWIKLSKMFTRAEMQVNRTLRLRFDPFSPSLETWLGKMVGGVTSALFLARKPEPPTYPSTWTEALRCPNCSTEHQEFGLAESLDEQLQCLNCGVVYPKHRGVFLLLSTELRKELYPEYAT